MNLTERAKLLFEQLNQVAEAGRWLRLWDRCIEFRLTDGPTFHLSVSRGSLRVDAGPSPTEMTCTALQTDSATMDEMLCGRISFTATGAGQAKRLRCVSGPSSFPDLSWVGVLLRLAQENR